MTESAFEEFSTTLDDQGTTKALNFLQQQFIDEGDFHKLFEILKMQVRQDLDLPIVFDPVQEKNLPPEVNEKLEEGMLNACRVVGGHLFKAGKPGEGWMYLQPVGDRAFTAELLRNIEIEEINEVNEETTEQIIDIALGQGVDPEYGFRLMLEQQGVCNAITTIDMKTGQGELDAQTLSVVCAILLEHFHADLLAKVSDDVAQRGASPNDQATLGQLLDQYDWIGAETGPHVDATHLASIVRLAKHVSQPHLIEVARDLCRYGLRLPEDFQYRGDIPFESTFADHLVYFDGLLGNDVDKAIDFFRQQMKTRHEYDQPIVIETLVAFLVKVDQRQEALDVALEHLAGKVQPMGIAPGLFDIANDEAMRKQLAAFFRTQNDLLGYAVCQLDDGL